MGVKSTIDLTRESAMDRATDLKLETMRRNTEARFVVMEDDELDAAAADYRPSLRYEDRQTKIRELGEQALQKQRRQVEAEFHVLDDKELEDELERLNDAANDGEGFENYSIVPHAGYNSFA
jgi:hypothetical protein